MLRRGCRAAEMLVLMLVLMREASAGEAPGLDGGEDGASRRGHSRPYAVLQAQNLGNTDLVFLRGPGQEPLPQERQFSSPVCFAFQSDRCLKCAEMYISQSESKILLGSVFGILLVAMILLSLCVYKPIRRR